MENLAPAYDRDHVIGLGKKQKKLVRVYGITSRLVPRLHKTFIINSTWQEKITWMIAFRLLNGDTTARD